MMSPSCLLIYLWKEFILYSKYYIHFPEAIMSKSQSSSIKERFRQYSVRSCHLKTENGRLFNLFYKEQSKSYRTHNLFLLPCLCYEGFFIIFLIYNFNSQIQPICDYIFEACKLMLQLLAFPHVFLIFFPPREALNIYKCSV